MRVRISHGQLGEYHATSWRGIITVGVLAVLQFYSPLLRECFPLLMIRSHRVASLLVDEKTAMFYSKVQRTSVMA